MIHDRSLPGGNRVQYARRLRRCHRANCIEILAHTFCPSDESGFSNVFGVSGGQELENRFTQLSFQLRLEAENAA